MAIADDATPGAAAATDGAEPGPGPPAISLPKGGGAIRGVGDKFAAAPGTGSGTLTVPLPVAEGRSGFGPKLALAYDSSAGNGPFGFGWRVPVPSITRKTDDGLPRYRDAEDSDVFVLAGAEDLVPALEHTPAGWVADEHDRAGYRIRGYRPRIEGLFARIERWTLLSNGSVHWRTLSRDNVLSVYGLDGTSQIADPGAPRRVFGWLLCRSYDDKGNAIVYEYAAEDQAGVDPSSAHEQGRGPGAQRYLKRIRYGNRVPLLLDAAAPSFRAPHVPEPALAGADWMFDVVLDYGEGHVRPQGTDAAGRAVVAAGLTAPAGSAWPERADAFSSYRPGFQVRTRRLCRRILTFHHFSAELGTADCLVRATELDYHEQPFGAFLVQVRQAGYDRRADGRYVEHALPPLDLAYSSSPLASSATPRLDVRDVDATSLENLPAGVDGVVHRWADLDGGGVVGALYDQRDDWLYKPNLGEGRFGPAQRLPTQPVVAAHQLADLSGTGTLDVVTLGPTPGFHARTEDEGWASFRAFDSVPNVAWADPNLRLVDLTGDRRPDLLITEDECLTWHRSLAGRGFAAGVRVSAPQDDDRGPRVVFAAADASIHVADVSGDGSPDILRIRNGEIVYWPNLGHGRFGAKVRMDNAPRIDPPDAFDQTRIRLADLDGSGTTDLVYLGAGGPRIYLNEAGNGWSDARVLDAFPPAHDAASVAVVDLLGRGTACLVWSSPLPGDTRRPMRYVDLMDGVKPHLLVEVRNNVGAETTVEYVSSTRFYLDDKAAGVPRVTRLPFPVHVVRRIVTRDRIGRTRFVRRYAYHHPHYDGAEGEFRGFGRIDQTDTETFAVLTDDGSLPPAANEDRSSHVAPTLTRSWFHTGAYFGRDRIARQFEAEYDQGDPGATLPDTVLEGALDDDEARQACRALKCELLRQEIYALDGRFTPNRPYSVLERAHAVRALQPRRDQRHAVFLVHPRETLDLRYERVRYPVAGVLRPDPRVTHALTLEVDDFGDVELEARVAYGRRFDDTRPGITDADRAEQRKLRATFTTRRVTSAVREEDAYRAPLAAETRTFELHGATPAAARFGSDELRTLIDASAVHELPYGDVDGAGVSGTAPFRRLIECRRTLYRRNDLTGPLPLGQGQALALPWETHRLALPAGLADALYVQSGKATAAELDALLGGECGYVHSEGDADWWMPSVRVGYSPAPGDPAATELAEAAAHFFMPRRHRDPFGANSTVRYDDHDLLVWETRDPLGNRVTVGERDAAGVLVANGNDYRALQPVSVMDANRNRSAVAYDALGLVAATAVMGKPGEALGDTLTGFDPDAPGLQGATTRIDCDLMAYERTAAQPHPDPVVAHTLARETHAAEPGGAATRIQHRHCYSDGFGREVQTKTQAEPGPLVSGGPVVDPRWVVDGWTIQDNKGNKVRRYEPFFDDNPGFRFGVTAGVSIVTLYDPLSRPVAVVQPDHSWSKTVFDPWGHVAWDGNDTVLVSDPAADPDAGDAIGRLPGADYLPTWRTTRLAGTAAEQDSAAKTAVHADSPVIALADPLGRNFLALAHCRAQRGTDPPTEERQPTRRVLDVEGNERALVDAHGRLVALNAYDMAERRAQTSSMEAGARWLLVDVAGKPVRAWDSRGHVLSTAYDLLRRPVRRTVRGTDAARSDPRTLSADVRFEEFEYGEGQPADVALNLRTRVVRRRDGSGETAMERYDFKGNLLRSTQRPAHEYKGLPDWSVGAALEPAHTSEATFDALDRPRSVTAPEGSVAYPVYNEAGLLDLLTGDLHASTGSTTFLAAVDYDAHRRRSRVRYGNGAETTYEYDTATFRLTRLRTTRPAAADALASQLFTDASVVQDLRYTYDPAGNITRIVDASLRTVFHAGAQVEPIWSCTYDSVYRLIEAGGREHIAQSAFRPGDGRFRDFPFAGATQLGDLQALRGYAERYDYDAVGNLTQIAHRATGGGWTRAYGYAEASALEPGQVSNRLSRTTLQPSGGPPVVEPYAYDDHGDVTQMPHLTLMEWDFRGRLSATSRQVVSATPPTMVPETTYSVYAPTGQRTRKVTERQNGTRRSERLYLTGVELYREYAGDGTTVTLERETLHVTDDRQRVAIVETEVSAGAAPAQRFQLGDHLGATRAELDAAGGLITHEEYTPYGDSALQGGRSAAEVSLKRYRAAHREREEETGFVHHVARYCAPWLGRWTSCDPAGVADGPNLYTYARGNPMRVVDPSGTQGEDVVRIPDPVSERTVVAHDDSVQGTVTQGDPAPSGGGGPPPDAEMAGDVNGAGAVPDAGQGPMIADAAIPPTADPATAGADARETTADAGARSDAPAAKTGVTPAPGATAPAPGASRESSWDRFMRWGYEEWNFTSSSELTVSSIVAVAAFVVAAAALMALTGRFDIGRDPVWLNVLRIGVTAVWVGLALVLARRDLVLKVDPSTVDKTPLDRWSIVHGLFGVVAGLWQVPFPVMAVLTVTWEVFEMGVPGFGEAEINFNRLNDIDLAWAGWAAFAALASLGSRTHFPHGFDRRSYTEDRLLGTLFGGR